MKTRVNLLTPDLFPPKVLISFGLTVKLVVLSLCIGIVVNAWLYWQQSQLESELSVERQSHSALKDNQQQLEQQFKNHKPDPRLVAQVKATDERLQIKQQLLDELDSRSRLSSQGFSILLSDLAQVSVPKLWLTRIKAGDKQFGFEGYSVQAQTVPFWIEQLKTTETLRGYAFAIFNMQRGEGQPIGFVLKSKSEDSNAAKKEESKAAKKESSNAIKFVEAVN